MARQTVEQPDVREVGGPRDGIPQRSDRRLFMLFQVFAGCRDTAAVAAALENASIEGALYESVHDPAAVGIVAVHEDPEHFVGPLRALFQSAPFDAMQLQDRFTMFGRTYGVGYEPDLEDALLGRPRRTVLNPDWPWAVWYPLRRAGAFATLDGDKQREILMEHGGIGRSFAAADLAHDVRLACHGLDPQDNDFVIGLVGKALHPLSAIVQRMRRTAQTSTYLERLGPFFVGRAAWQSELGT